MQMACIMQRLRRAPDRHPHTIHVAHMDLPASRRGLVTNQFPPHAKPCTVDHGLAAWPTRTRKID